MIRLVPPPRLPAIALIVFSVALGLRLGHLAGLHESWAGTQLFSMARGDAADHWREAQEILRGEHALGERVPWKGVGYSYILAGTMRLLGTDPGRLRFGFALLGAFNCALLVLLARRRLSLVWSAAAGLLAACNGVLILFDGELFFPTVLIALSLWSLLLLSSTRRSLIKTAFAGICMGAATLVHPVYLLSTLAMAGWLLRRPRRAHAPVFLLLAGLTLLPVSLANWIGAGQPVLVSWSGGINLYLGNQPAFDQTAGQSTSAWSRIYNSTAESGLLREVDRDRHYYRLTFEQWTKHPLQSIQIFARKLRVLLSPVEISNNVRLYELRDASPVLRLTMGRWGPFAYPFVFWFPAALLGSMVAWRRCARTPGGCDLIGLVGAWSGGLIVSILLSFNAARYRAPLIFFGCILVSLALSALWQRWRRAGATALLLPIAAYIGLTLLCAALAVQQKSLPAPAAWSQALYCESSGRIGEASDWLERALAESPDDPHLMLESARFHARHGNDARAVSTIMELLALPALEPDLRVMAYQELAYAAMRARDWDRARESLLAALQTDPDRSLWHGKPFFWLNLNPVTRCRLELLLADVELRAKQPERAGEYWDETQLLCPEMSGDLKLAARRTDLELRSRRGTKQKK